MQKKLKLKPATKTSELRAALAPFAITITPAPNNDGWQVDVSADPDVLPEAEIYADFIARQLVNHPDRPSRRAQ